jgi:hypothetical protein
MSSWHSLLEQSLNDFHEQHETEKAAKAQQAAQIAQAKALFERQQQIPRRRVENKRSEKIALVDENGAEPVLLTLADCDNCRIDVNAPTVKIFVTRCHNTKVRLRSRIVTSYVEVTRCEGSTLLLNVAVGTVQVDMSSNFTLDFAEADFMDTMWLNRCETIRLVHPLLAEPALLPVGRKIVEASNNSWLDDQFRVRVKSDDGRAKVQCLIVEREAGGFIKESKQDEIDMIRDVRRAVSQAMSEKLSGASSIDAGTPNVHVRVDPPPSDAAAVGSPSASAATSATASRGTSVNTTTASARRPNEEDFDFLSESDHDEKSDAEVFEME